MPHSLYLGSGMVQSRLRDYDTRSGWLLETMPPSSTTFANQESSDKAVYLPSLPAIRYAMKFSIIELALSLCTFALFVNSAILIVAGSSLYDTPEAQGADIFSIHDLLAADLAPAAGTIFALALLLSGISAGIVCTIAGQMVSEGALNWRMQPWLRRLLTRSISITPSIIIAGAVGRSGLGTALVASQVILSVVLPFVTAPLIWFTAMNRYMTVKRGRPGYGVPTARAFGQPHDEADVKMRNSFWVTGCAILIWLIITAMNIANLVLLAIRQE
jgi:metal iron transporter